MDLKHLEIYYIYIFLICLTILTIVILYKIDKINFPTSERKIYPRIKEETKINVLFLFVFFAVITLWYKTPDIVSNFFNISREKNGGTFGDTFGFINALFSGLAFTGIVYTILIQRYELKEQKNQFLKQNIENKVFRMVDIHTLLLNSISINNEKGTDAFKYLSHEFINSLKDYKPANVDNIAIEIQNKFNEVYSNYNSELDNYIKNILKIIVYIHNIEFLEIDEKQELVDILKFLLYSEERLFLALYAYFMKSEKFHDLLEIYNFFDKGFSLNKDSYILSFLLDKYPHYKNIYGKENKSTKI